MDVFQTYISFAKKERAIPIGESLFHRPVYAFFVGNPNLQPVIVQASIHAREWLTTYVALAMTEQAKRATGAFWFIPMLNPDGVLLATRGISTVEKSFRKDLLAINKSEDFSLWKANGRGVDLNVNFPAGFGKGRQNVFSPASANYVGKAPASEPCTRAIMDFTRAVQPKLTLSLHTKGEVVYWHYQSARKDGFCGDFKRGKKIFYGSGYSLQKSIGSVGGYKDWCIEQFGIPAYTVEIGRDIFPHPLTEAELPNALKKTKEIIPNLSEVCYANERRKIYAYGAERSNESGRRR